MRLLLPALVALWVLVSLVTGAQYYLVAALRGQAVALPEAIFLQAAAGVTWFPAGYAVVRLARRFPLDGRRWRSHLVVHLAAAVATAFALNIAITLLWLAGGVDLAPRQGFWNTALTGFLNFLHINVLFYAVIVGLVHAADHFRAARERELRAARTEALLAQARLESLRAQLHPHFLFNALHTIGLLWRAGRGEEAQGVLDRLAALLRRALDSDAAHEVALDDELSFVREYLEIERVRFRDRLAVEVEVAAEALDARVPAMLLQPLVENAVRHGVAARGTGGRVTVRAARDGDALVVEVCDDGPGIPPAPSGRSPNGGIGLRNTRERLARLYGAAATLELTALPAGGTSALVRLPFRPVEGE